VRSAREWSSGHIESALNLPLSQLTNRLAELPPDRPLIVYCASGYRSSAASSLLRREGVEPVANLVGGLAAWSSAQLPSVVDAAAESEERAEVSAVSID
jgi:hydroxyacylglutathione hydrolase